MVLLYIYQRVVCVIDTHTHVKHIGFTCCVVHLRFEADGELAILLLVFGFDKIDAI